MRKKLLASLLMLVMVISSLGVSSPSVQAAAATNSYKEETMLLSGIMEGFTLAKLASTKSTVSRQQFAKMLVNASSYQGQVETSLKTSLYKDVSYKNKYAGYIKIAVEQGWMSATVAGKFNPSTKIKTKDAAKAVLALLGYTRSDFSGNLVTAQMSKFNALGLNDNVNKTKNKTLTFADCTDIFYNLLSTKTTQGTAYGTSLSVPLDTDGEVDYLSLLKTNLEGPVLLTSSLSSTLDFTNNKTCVYKNEVTSNISSISSYDVIYYSEKLNTIWAYNTKVSGTLQSVSPSRTAPTSVTIGSDSYTLGTKEMIYAFSSLGSFSLNSPVTLFLGMDNEVVAALSSADYSIDTYGVVLSIGTYIGSSSSTDTNNRYLTMLTPNGNTSTYYYKASDLTVSVGNLVHVTYTNGTESIERITSTYAKLYNCIVSASASKIGSYKVASDAVIMDTNKGSYQKINLSTIDGVTLNYSNVLYYEFNSAGEISSLILNSVTSGNYSYGVITAITTPSSGGAAIYTYLADGTTKTVSSTLVSGSVVAGTGLRIDTYNDTDGKVSAVSFTSLASASVTSLTSSTITTADWSKSIASNAYCYYVDSQGSYHVTTLSSISSLTKYKLTAYYDNTTGISKEVCMIVASDN